MNKALTADKESTAGVFSGLTAFENAQRIAQALCSSRLVPDHYRGTENLGSALIALELAQRLDMPPLMIMQNLDVIGGRPAWRAQMVIALINKSLKFKKVDFAMGGSESNPTCKMVALDAVSDEAIEGPEVSLHMAKQEGWYDRKGSKWKTIPELMLRYRAAAWFGRLYCPELLLGVATEEEAYDVIDVTPTREPEASESSGPASRVLEAIAKGPQQKSEDTCIDIRGIAFDERIHATAANGHPAILGDGRFRRKRGCSLEYQKEIEDLQEADVQEKRPDQEAKKEPDIPNEESLAAVSQELGFGVSR